MAICASGWRSPPTSAAPSASTACRIATSNSPSAPCRAICRSKGCASSIDCANGAAYQVAPDALWELGAEVITFGVEPDGFNINKECGSTEPAALCQQGARDARRYRHRARRRRRPRADRRRARPHRRRRPAHGGDRRKLAGRRPSRQARRGRNRDVQSRPRALSRHVWACARPHARSATATCSSTCASMATTSAAKPPATSSCRTTPPPATACVAALQVLAVVKKQDKPVSKVCHRFEPLPQVLQATSATRAASRWRTPRSASPSRAPSRRLNGHGRLVIRPSGTEPVIRVMGEGDDKVAGRGGGRRHRRGADRRRLSRCGERAYLVPLLAKCAQPRQCALQIRKPTKSAFSFAWTRGLMYR